MSRRFSIAFHTVLSAFGIILLLSCCFRTAMAAESSLIRDIKVQNGSMVTFNKYEHQYLVELNSGEEYADLIVTPIHDDVILEISGNEQTIDPGEKKTIEIMAYDAEGNSDSYHLTVYSKAEVSLLSFLQCLNGTMTPQYSATNRTYYIVLPAGEETARLDIRTRSHTDTVTVSGNEELQIGRRSKAVISIRDENGTEDQYTLLIYRASEIQPGVNSKYLLKSLQINAGAIGINFNKNQAYYKVMVPRHIHQVDVSALAENRSNVVEVIGTQILSDTQPNIVSVIVFDPDDPSSGKSVYTIEMIAQSFRGIPEFSKFQLFSVFVASFLCGGTLTAAVLYRMQKKKEENDQPDQKV